VTQATRKKTAAKSPAWTRLADRELLALRFRDLKLTLKGSPLEPCIRRLYRELDRAGLKFHPHCWLAEEWFSPDGVPGIAIPFFLAHPRLKSLERRMMREVEGGNTDALMGLLRHEAGHAIDTAFRLRRRADWRAVFGRASKPYEDSYRPKPGSRRYVEHLDAWYAQSHPTEDFAETFAVWLASWTRWRRTYREWPAYSKLEFVEELMRELCGRRPVVRGRYAVEALREDPRTLEEYYRTKLSRYAPMREHVTDHLIRRVFSTNPSSARTMRAATLLRARRVSTVKELAVELEVSQYLVGQVMRLVIQRCEVLGLYVRGPVGEARRKAHSLVRRVARLHLSGRTGRHVR